MRRIGLFIAGVLCFCLLACDADSKFQVSGTVSDAEGKILYLEEMDLNGVVIMDSVRLKSGGSYRFKGKRPDAPEFYRLRIENKIINFSIDSTESVKINAPFETFATNYTVEGSENVSKIKELVIRQAQLQQQVNQLMDDNRNNRISYSTFESKFNELISAYKDSIKINYIFVAPNTPYAYFALFQKVNNYMIFDPYSNKNDIRAFAAVATSYDVFYPHSDRSRNLRNMTIKGMKNTRSPQQPVASELPVVQEATIIDIDLKDMKGNDRKLTDLKGKVVLLDFTVYQNAISISHNFALRDLYDKYADQGLEIYQVSLDNDEHFWKITAGNLPWICVRDPNGIYSTIAATYNVQQIPTYFLVSRKNELSARDENIKNLENEIKKLL